MSKGLEEKPYENILSIDLQYCHRVSRGRCTRKKEGREASPEVATVISTAALRVSKKLWGHRATYLRRCDLQGQFHFSMDLVSKASVE